MRFSLSVLAVAASLAFANAQDFGDIPQCALTCFAVAVPAAGCSLSDTKCQCTTGADSITKSVTDCAPSKCSAEDIAKIAPAVETICAKAGVTVSNLPTAVSTASGSGSSASRTASATGSASQSSTATGSGGAAQNTGAAAVNYASVGAVALGLAAVLGL